MTVGDRVILHCDLNCFFASVELLDKPALWEVPVAVCGDPKSRHGIILAKNEPAKRRGVKTAETIWQARKKCPGLVLLPPHHELYREYSRRVNEIYDRFTDLVEPFGIDESWLDITGSMHLFGGDPVAIADELRRRGFTVFDSATNFLFATTDRMPCVEIFEKLPDEINHLVSEFSSTPVVGDLSCGITQYSFWLIVSTIVLLIVLAVFKKKQTLVPKGFFVNGFEYIIEYVENDIGKGVVGENWKKHFPFLCSLFLFILINNMIGLIPGMKPGTGAIGSTAALAIFAFVYFIYYGCKAHGVIGYIKSLAPQGVSFPMNVLVWVVELFSTFLRLITLAVRLFCNMFAGHVVMGSFAIMASMFMQPLLQQVSAAHAVGALPSLAWLAILILIYTIELVVGAIQAYVFTVLTAVYVSEAEEVAEEE